MLTHLRQVLINTLLFYTLDALVFNMNVVKRIPSGNIGGLRVVCEEEDQFSSMVQNATTGNYNSDFVIFVI
jgi:hypothetical protein